MGRRRRRYKRKTGMGYILVLVLIIFGTVSYARARLDVERAALQKQQAAAEQKLADEQERSSQIEDLRAYVQTKKFVEETAREKFGMVYKNEVIFKSDKSK